MQPRTIRPAADPEEVRVGILPDPAGLPACTSTGHPFRVLARGTTLVEFSGDPGEEIRCAEREWVG